MRTEHDLLIHPAGVTFAMQHANAKGVFETVGGVEVKLECLEPNLALVDYHQTKLSTMMEMETGLLDSEDQDEDKDPNDWPSLNSEQLPKDDFQVKEDAIEEAKDESKGHQEIEGIPHHSTSLNAPEAMNVDMPVKIESKKLEPSLQHMLDIEPVEQHIRKRRRVEVLLPTLAEIKRKYKEELCEDFKKLKAMKNPAVKTKSKMQLSPDTIRARLIPIGLELFGITLDKPSQDVTVTRRFMSQTFGGSEQGIFPSIGKKFLRKHGMNDFMYLNPDFQPEGPQVPGAPGLYFNLSKGPDFSQIMRVLTRIEGGVWQYMGMYRVDQSDRPTLTRAEWLSQSTKVRKTWAQEIEGKCWGWSVRVRIAGRKLFEREPTAKECDDLVKTDAWKHVTAEEIECAYDEGKEKIGVWTMKCVDYDNAFQLQICDKFPSFVPLPRQPRGTNTTDKKKEKKPNQKIEQDKNPSGSSTRRGSGGTKRKRLETPESESEEDATDWASQSEFSDTEILDEGRLYRNRGTRSRPIVL